MFDRTAVVETELTTSVELTAAPNPFEQETVMQFELHEASIVSLVVLDMTGKIVETVLPNTELGKGSHEAVFSANGRPAGVYVAMLKINGQSIARKLMLQR